MKSAFTYIPTCTLYVARPLERNPARGAGRPCSKYTYQTEPWKRAPRAKDYDKASEGHPQPRTLTDRCTLHSVADKDSFIAPLLRCKKKTPHHGPNLGVGRPPLSDPPGARARRRGRGGRDEGPVLEDELGLEDLAGDGASVVLRQPALDGGSATDGEGDETRKKQGRPKINTKLSFPAHKTRVGS